MARVKPANSQVTPEAAEALRLQGINPDDTDSDTDLNSVLFVGETESPSDGTDPETYFGVPESVITSETAPEDIAAAESAGDIVDAELVDDAPAHESVIKTFGFGNRRRGNKRERDNEPKGTPPNVDEWLDFFSRIVIRFLTEWYVDMMFHDINEDDVTESDAAKLLLDPEERDIIARPFAEYANKNPFMKKHGRQIVAFADSFESVVILARWFGRVNRIHRKYRPQQKKPVRSEVNLNGHRSESTQGTTGGQVSNGFAIYNPGSS